MKPVGSTQPTLDSPRLELRKLCADDAPRIAQLAGAPEVAATTLLIPHPYSAAMATDFIALVKRDAAEAPPRQFVWGICRPDDQLMGCIGLTFNWPHARAEVGYWIGVPYWGAGYATEALGAVLAWGFGAIGLNRIDAHHMAHNPASGRVLLKAGMSREGVVREHVRKNGLFVDGVVYSILRREWHPERRDAEGRAFGDRGGSRAGGI